MDWLDCVLIRIERNDIFQTGLTVHQAKGGGGLEGMGWCQMSNEIQIELHFLNQLRRKMRAVLGRAWQIKYLRHCLGAPSSSSSYCPNFPWGDSGNIKIVCRWTLYPACPKPCPSHPCLSLLLSFQFSSFAWLYLTPPATPSTWGWAHNLALSFNATLCGTGLSHIFMLPIHPQSLLLCFEQLTWKTF